MFVGWLSTLEEEPSTLSFLRWGRCAALLQACLVGGGLGRVFLGQQGRPLQDFVRLRSKTTSKHHPKEISQGSKNIKRTPKHQNTKFWEIHQNNKTCQKESFAWGELPLGSQSETGRLSWEAREIDLQGSAWDVSSFNLDLSLDSLPGSILQLLFRLLEQI